MTMSNRIVATIKTAVPALWGLLIAWAIAQVPAIGTALEWMTVQAGTDITKIIEWILTAAVIAGFYWVASKIGARWPAVQTWLLGSSLVPIYVPPMKE